MGIKKEHDINKEIKIHVGNKTQKVIIKIIKQ